MANVVLSANHSSSLAKFQLLTDVDAQLVWADEPLATSDLSTRERHKFASFDNSERSHEWLIGRRALKWALKTYGLDIDTMIYSMPSPFLSLSHCNDCAVALILEQNQKKGISGVGVDFEMLRTIDDKALPFFLSTREQNLVTTEQQKLRLWTIKEALFKADPNNFKRWLTDYETDDDNGYGRGMARSRTGDLFSYESIEVGNGFLSIAIHHEG